MQNFTISQRIVAILFLAVFFTALIVFDTSRLFL